MEKVVLFILIGVIMYNSRNVLVGFLTSLALLSFGVSKGIFPSEINIIIQVGIIYIVSIVVFFIRAMLMIIIDLIKGNGLPDWGEIQLIIFIGFIPLINMIFLRDDDFN